MIQVGFATSDISSLAPPGTGIRRPLGATCMVIAPPGPPVLLFSLDLTELSVEQCSCLAGQIGHATGIPAGRVLLHTQHTHSAPWVQSIGTCEIERLAEILTTCALQAQAQARQAWMRCGRADVPHRLSVHRRGDTGHDLGVQTFWYGYLYREGDDRPDASALVREMTCRWRGEPARYEAQEEPVWFDGPVDPWVQALSFETGDGEPLGSVVRFSAHPHLSSLCRERLWDPDYPGVVADVMRNALGGPCLFLSGPCGNLVPAERVRYVLDPNRTHEGVYLGATSLLVAADENEMLQEMGRIGRTVAETALHGLSDAARVPLEQADLRHEEIPFVLDDSAPRTRAEARRRHAALASEVEAYRRTGGPPCELRRLANRLNRLDWTGDFVEQFVRSEDWDAGCVAAPIWGLALNEARLAFMPNEIMVETTLALRETFPRPDFWTVGLTGGCLGYLPTARIFDEGGYEGRQAILARDSEQRLRDLVVSMLLKMT